MGGVVLIVLVPRLCVALRLRKANTMATTSSIIGVTASTLSTLVPTVDQTKLVLHKTENNKDGSVSMIFQNRASDPRYLDTIVVTTKSVQAAGKPVYVEWRIVHNTYVLVDDSVTDSNDVWYPTRVELSGRFPLAGQTAAQVLAHIGTLYGLMYPSAAAGVPNTKQAENLLFGSGKFFVIA